MPIYRDGNVDFGVDNRGRYWIYDSVTKTRYEVGGPGSGSYKAAEVLYGPVRRIDTLLTGWREHAGGAVDFFGGPNRMEEVISGRRADPFTGAMVPKPQSITSGSGVQYNPPGQGGVGVPGSAENPIEVDYNGYGSRFIPAEFRGVAPSGEPVHFTNPRATGRGSSGQQLGADQRNAFAVTQQLLAEYGLSGLTGQVKQWLMEGLSIEEIMLELPKTKEYKARFPGMALREQNGHDAISEREYIALERSYRNTFRRADLPPGYSDSAEDLAAYIGADVSPAEMEFRVFEGVLAAQNAPQEIKDALSQFYGVGNTTAALAAYYLDPEKGEETIQREFAAATIGGAAERTGFGMIARQSAERLAANDVTGQEAEQGFSQLERDSQLMQALPGEVGATLVTRGEQMEATFLGDAEDQDEIRRQRERRLAAFAGQGQSSADQSGVGGLRGS